MKTVKRTYVLPPDIVQQFEMEVITGNRSSLIAQLLQDWLRERRRSDLRRDVIAGCRDMADIYLDVAREWEVSDDELHRTIVSE